MPEQIGLRTDDLSAIQGKSPPASNSRHSTTGGRNGVPGCPRRGDEAVHRSMIKRILPQSDAVASRPAMSVVDRNRHLIRHPSLFRRHHSNQQSNGDTPPESREKPRRSEKPQPLREMGSRRYRMPDHSLRPRRSRMLRRRARARGSNHGPGHRRCTWRDSIAGKHSTQVPHPRILHLPPAMVQRSQSVLSLEIRGSEGIENNHNG
jgi:hypothetical protein